MEFVGGFPMTHRGHKYFIFMVDYISKMCVLIPCKNMIFGHEVVDLFMFGYILDFQAPIYLIDIAGYWVDFGQHFEKEWIPS
jgi:hypothetical protein